MSVAALEEIKEINLYVHELLKSPHYKKLGPEGIFAIVTKARSMGLSHADVLQCLNGGMYYVRGKVELASNMMNDLIRRNGHSITKDKKSDDKICILHGRRKDNGDTWSESFSIEDAQRAGIYANQWLTYPKDMLFARALSRLARQLFPDVIKGCYVEGEIRQATSVKQIEALEVPQMTLEEVKEVILNNIPLEEPEFLEEYLAFVNEKVQKPMPEVLQSWLSNPEPFQAHYGKWCVKKLLERKPPTVDIEEREPSLFAELG